MARKVWLPVLLLAILCTPAQAQPVRRDYNVGDWVSFIEQRHVTGLAQGFDILYFATPYGVGRYHTVARRFLLPLTASSGLDNPEILQIAYDERAAELWIDTPLGPASYIEVFEEWRPASEFPAGLVRNDVARLNYTNLFTPWGLSYHGRGSGSPYGMFIDQQLRQFPVSSALRDIINGDRVYIGTWGKGPGEIDHLGERVTFHAWGLYQPIVQAIHAIDDEIYFAGAGAGDEPPVISIFNTPDSTWSYLEPFYEIAASGDVTSIASLDDMVFFGTPRGLLKYESKKKRWRKYGASDGIPDNQITALRALGDLVWVGTRLGPGILDPRADTGTIAISLANGDLGSAFVYALDTAYGFVWAATDRGLHKIDPDRGDWRRVVSGDGLLGGRVRDISVRPEGIWCATDAGLILIDSTHSSVEVFRSRVELTDGNLFALAVDGHNIWASSRSGVWRYIRAKSKWRLYTRADGLLDDFVFDIHQDGDHVWFGTSEGVSRFFWNSPLRVE